MENKLNLLQRNVEELRIRAMTVPETAPESAVRFPSCRALSVLFYGDYSRMDEAWLRLGREAKERGLAPAALLRVIGIVAPYTGREIVPEKYCSRLVMPVAEK